MNHIDNKLFVPTVKGVHILVYGEPQKKRFISNEWYSGDRLNEVLGLDKPKNRIKAICK